MPRAKRKSPTVDPPKTQKSGVAIRMYDCGFGDCFLLTFHAQDGSPRYVLIDCGIHNQYKSDLPETNKLNDNKVRMQEIAKNIYDVTGHHLHIVAVTHEHTDHILGFTYARDIFENIQIDDLWLAWTENDQDDVTKTLKRSIKKGVEELTSGMNKLTQIDSQMAATISDLLGFESVFGAAGKKETELDFLRRQRAKVNKNTLKYCYPGEDPLIIPDVSGVKVHVLGPPKDPDQIKNLKEGNELYPEFAAISEFRSFASALNFSLGNIAKEDEDNMNRDRPFSMHYSVFPQDEETDRKYRSFFQEFYGFGEGKGQGEVWRRIDNDWMETASELALKINDYTNNTSLVLAFELTDMQPSKVLLFVGDAQIGNWLSWYDKDTVKVDVKDLLRRTVFYKVGHHCSRNATLREKGLELMEYPGLAAMIPVDEKWAKNKSPPWEHPADKLLDRLEEKTRTRVIRTDKLDLVSNERKNLKNLEESDRKTFLGKVTCDDSGDNLWVEYIIEG